MDRAQEESNRMSKLTQLENLTKTRDRNSRSSYVAPSPRNPFPHMSIDFGSSQKYLGNPTQTSGSQENFNFGRIARKHWIRRQRQGAELPEERCQKIQVWMPENPNVNVLQNPTYMGSLRGWDKSQLHI